MNVDVFHIGTVLSVLNHDSGFSPQGEDGQRALFEFAMRRPLEGDAATRERLLENCAIFILGQSPDFEELKKQAPDVQTYKANIMDLSTKGLRRQIRAIATPQP